jgi:YD repeat-containing protein
MKKLLTAVSFVVLFTSCQKEVSFDSGGTGGGSNGGGSGSGSGSGSGTGSNSGLLIKSVAVTGSETVTTQYTYDTSKRLLTHTDKGVGGGVPVDSYRRFVRDGAGRIIKVVQKLGDVNGMPSDTAYFNYHYPNATTMDPDYGVSVMSMSMGGITMATIDSSVYNYAGGKLASYNSYMSSNMMGMVMPVSESRWEYTYNASGYVVMLKLFNNTTSGAPLTEMYNVTNTYGSTVNHVYASPSAMQNFIINGLPHTSATLVTKMVANSVGVSPPVNVVTDFTYTLTNGRVTSGTSNTVSTGQPARNTNYTFFYQ